VSSFSEYVLDDENDAQNFIAPRLVERLGSTPSNP